MDKSKLITFLDAPGRSILAELISETDQTITVKNPAIINVTPAPNNQLSIQLIPLFFREFVSQKNQQEGTLWEYPKVNIVRGLNIENDSRLTTQYTQIFQQKQESPATPPKIKLFDE